MTTCCPKCENRFYPKLIWIDSYSTSELTFYCVAQLFPKLIGKEFIRPEEFKKKHPAVFHSALVHFGTLKNAFKEIDIKYKFSYKTDWKAKIRPFLGKLPDNVIAMHVDKPSSSVSRLRKSLGIPKFEKNQALEEFE